LFLVVAVVEDIPEFIKKRTKGAKTCRQQGMSYESCLRTA